MNSLPVRIAAEVVRLLRDRVTGSSRIPRTLAAITPGWLTRLTGHAVTSVEQIEATRGTTARARLRLEGEGAPASVFVKLAPTALATRAFVDLMGLGSAEVRFYRQIRPGLPIAAPAVHGTSDDRSTGRFALVLEDLALPGVRFGDVRRPADLDEASAVVAALARFHASFWESERFGRDLSWVVSHATDPNNALVRPFVRTALRRVSALHGHLVPSGTTSMVARRSEIERALSHGPITLLHGDPHLGNLYFDGAMPGFLDWQVVRKGHGLRDLAYFLVLSLDTDLRRASQTELVQGYVRELAARGIQLPPFEDSWRRFRQEAFYPWIAAVVTTGLGGLQAHEIATVGLGRAAAALEDLETVSVLRESLR